MRAVEFTLQSANASLYWGVGIDQYQLSPRPMAIPMPIPPPTIKKGLP
jgi:hypothetical protein